MLATNAVSGHSFSAMRRSKIYVFTINNVSRAIEQFNDFTCAQRIN